MATACVIYDNQTKEVSISTEEFSANIVAKGRNEAASALRNEAERYGDEIEYVIYAGDNAYNDIKKRNITSYWKEMKSNILPNSVSFIACSLILSILVVMWSAALFLPSLPRAEFMTEKERFDNRIYAFITACIMTSITAFCAKFFWKETAKERQERKHIRKFGFRPKLVTECQQYSHNMIGIGKDSLYVFSHHLAHKDLTVNRIDYKYVQNVRESEYSSLNFIGTDGRLTETIYNYKSEYKGDVINDILNRKL